VIFRPAPSDKGPSGNRNAFDVFLDDSRSPSTSQQWPPNIGGTEAPPDLDTKFTFLAILV
jgi:hypothetical protein